MSTETQTTHATPAPDAVQPDERRKLALDAFNELDALLDLVPQVDPDNLFALRGLTLRANDLLFVIYTAALDLTPSPSDLEESRRKLYGFIRGHLGDGEE